MDALAIFNLDWVGAAPEVILATIVGAVGFWIKRGFFDPKLDVDNDPSLHNPPQSKVTRAIRTIHSVNNNLPADAKAMTKFLMEEYLKQIERVHNHQQFEMRGGYFFTEFWVKTMQELKPCTLCATAQPYKEYFWENADIFPAQQRFVARGGRIIRFFIRHDNETPEQKREAEETLTKHESLNESNAGHVFTWHITQSDHDKLGIGSPHFMIIDELEERLFWELQVENGRIRRVWGAWDLKREDGEQSKLSILDKDTQRLYMKKLLAARNLPDSPLQRWTQTSLTSEATQ